MFNNAEKYTDYFFPELSVLPDDESRIQLSKRCNFVSLGD
jgi:hypothetical protein